MTGDDLARLEYCDDAWRAIVTVERRAYDVVLITNTDAGGKE